MATDEPASNPLLSLYRRYVGDPQREGDVYIGFALFFGGIALGAIGLLVFLWSTTVPAGTDGFWQLREIAIGSAAIGLPAFILSVVVLLPVTHRAVTIAALGSAVCLLAVGVFIATYPTNWNVTGTTDYSSHGIAVYAGGLAVLVATTGAALVAHHIERTTPTSAHDDSAAPDQASGANAGAETVTREQVERDIDAALAETELTWGGVEKSSTPELRVETPDVETAEVDQSGFDGVSAQTKRADGVDDAVSGLRKLQGGERKTATGAAVDDQTAALRDLRERQRQEAANEPESMLERAKGWFGLG